MSKSITPLLPEYACDYSNGDNASNYQVVRRESPPVSARTTQAYFGDAKCLLSKGAQQTEADPEAGYIAPDFPLRAPETYKARDLYFSQRLAMSTLYAAGGSYVEDLYNAARACRLEYEAMVRLEGGLPGTYTSQSLHAERLPSAFLSDNDLFGSILRRLTLLVMPSQFDDSRDVYIDCLNVDDLVNTARSLTELHVGYPGVVKSLLSLREEDACNQIIATSTWSSWPAELKELLAGMMRIKVAHWLNNQAMIAAAHLHRPYGCTILDNSDLPDAVRYGHVHRRLTEEFEFVRAVVALYQSGQSMDMIAAARKMSPSCTSALAIFTPSPADIRQHIRRLNVRLRAPAALEVMAKVRDLGLEDRARTQLAIWQKECGESLPEKIDAAVSLVRARLAILGDDLKCVKSAGGSMNKRVANMGVVEPLVLLYSLCRVAVAWTNEPPSGESGVSKYVEWLTGPHRATTPPPTPCTHRNQGGSALELFSIVRMAIVEDDNMVPNSLQRQRLEDGSFVDVKSQAGALVVLGRRFLFSELWNAHAARREVRSEIVGKAGNKSRYSAAIQGAVKQLLAPGCS